MWGDWYLQFPIIGPMDLGSITSPEGELIILANIPVTPPAPCSIPMQALIEAELSNLTMKFSLHARLSYSSLNDPWL